MNRSIAITAIAGLLSGASAAIAEDGMIAKETHARPFVVAYLVKKKEEMSYAAFRAYQLETHVPLALALPGLRDYRLTFFPPQQGQAQPFDALAQVTFTDAAAHEAAMASEQGQKALGDLANFLDMSAIAVLTSGTGDFIASE